MTDLMKLAKQYVDHSNNHDADACAVMFAADATYSSSGVGEHSGIANIKAMMEKFFKSYPDVTWTCSNWRDEPNNAVSFSFDMKGHHAETGEMLERSSTEWLFFDAQGRITRVEVH